MVLAVLLSSSLFAVELRVLVESPQEDIGLEQLGLPFPIELLLQTQLVFVRQVPFKCVKLCLDFMLSPDPEFTQEDVPLRTLTGCLLSIGKTWLSSLHFLLT